MLGIIGIVVIFAMVFGGYVLAGGKMGIILKALPFEMMMIGGAALGTFLLGNDGGVVKHTLKDISKVFKGAHWKPGDYKDLLCLLFELIRLARQSPVAIEEHVETPGESSIFSKYPKIQGDKVAIELICDTMRSMSMNYDDPHQVEEVLDKRIEALQHHRLHSSHALQSTADALPDGFTVATVHESRVAYRPWTFAAPMIDRFIAVDLANRVENAQSEGLFLVRAVAYGRWQPAREIELMVDCAGGRTAIPAGDGGEPVWRPAGVEDPILRTVCTGAETGAEGDA